MANRRLVQHLREKTREVEALTQNVASLTADKEQAQTQFEDVRDRLAGMEASHAAAAKHEAALAWLVLKLRNAEQRLEAQTPCARGDTLAGDTAQAVGLTAVRGASIQADAALWSTTIIHSSPAKRNAVQYRAAGLGPHAASSSQVAHMKSSSTGGARDRDRDDGEDSAKRHRALLGGTSTSTTSTAHAHSSDSSAAHLSDARAPKRPKQVPSTLIMVTGCGKGDVLSKEAIQGKLKRIDVPVCTGNTFKSTITHVVTPRHTVSWRTRAAWVSGAWIMPLKWVCQR